MNTLVNLFKDSYIIRGVITVLLIGAIVTLWVMKADVPPELLNLVLIVTGYYFGVVSEKARLTKTKE